MKTSNSKIVINLETGYYECDDKAGKGKELPTPCLSIFSSAQAATRRREGIDVLEENLLFFAADGSPLEVHFTKMPFVDDAKKKYFPGEYSLRSATGENLLSSLTKILAQNPSSYVRVIVYRPDDDEDAQWYGWPSFKSMGENIDEVMKILPDAMQKRIQFE